MASLLKLHASACALLNLLGAITLVLIVFLICVDVIGRAFFGSPLFGVPEIVKMSVVAIAWFQMAHTLRIGAHLRTTVLIDRLPVLRYWMSTFGPRAAIPIVSAAAWGGITVLRTMVDPSDACTHSQGERASHSGWGWQLAIRRSAEARVGGVGAGVSLCESRIRPPSTTLVMAGRKQCSE